MRWAGFATVIVLLAVGCGSSSAPPSPSVIGFGATTQDWNAHHTADPNAGTDLAYNPTPNLPEGHEDEYYAVLHDFGHVGRYEMVFQPVTESAARHLLMKEFPRDAWVRWFQRSPSCARMEVHSAALGRALANPKIGDRTGEGYVELTTGSGLADPYDPNGVDGAIVTYGLYKTPSAAPPC